MGSFIFLIPSLLDRKHSIYFRFQKLFLSFTTFKIVHIRSGDWKLLELSTKFREVMSDCGDAKAKAARQRTQMECARLVLDRSTVLLVASTKCVLRHPDR